MANDPQTFSELQASVLGWLNRAGDANITNKLPEIIALAERRLSRILNTPEMEATTTLSASATTALPTDFREARNLYLDTDPRQPLESVSLAYLRERYSAQTTGRPEVYAISGANIVLGPAPDTAYSLVLVYKQTIPPLSDSNTTNWLLTKHPDLYVAACCLSAQTFTFGDEKDKAEWSAIVETFLAEIQQEGQRKRYGAAPLRLRSPVAWGG